LAAEKAEKLFIAKSLFNTEQALDTFISDARNLFNTPVANDATSSFS